MADKKTRRKRGQRDDGRILVTLTLGRDRNGKLVRKYFYGDTRREAESKRDDYLRKRQLGLFADASTMTLNDWIDEWLNTYKQNSRSLYPNASLYYVNRLRNALGSRLIQSIREVDLQKALYEVSGMSQSTISKYNSIIRQIFARAVRNKIILDDPSVDLDVPTGVRGTHRAIEAWEYELIIRHWKACRAGLWAMVMLFCGLRRGELIALDWSNVDMDARQIRVCQAAVIPVNQVTIVNHTKTTAGMRVIPICLPLYTALDSIPIAERVGPVCKSAHGKLLSESAFTRGWESFNTTMQRIANGQPPTCQGKRNDIIGSAESPPKVIFNVRAHDLRHTFATALYDAGVSCKAAQYYLGHASLKMTLELYTHLSAERAHTEYGKLVDFMDSWNPIRNLTLKNEKNPL